MYFYNYFFEIFYICTNCIINDEIPQQKSAAVFGRRFAGVFFEKL